MAETKTDSSTQPSSQKTALGITQEQAMARSQQAVALLDKGYRPTEGGWVSSSGETVAKNTAEAEKKGLVSPQQIASPQEDSQAAVINPNVQASGTITVRREVSSSLRTGAVLGITTEPKKTSVFVNEEVAASSVPIGARKAARGLSLEGYEDVAITVRQAKHGEEYTESSPTSVIGIGGMPSTVESKGTYKREFTFDESGEMTSFTPTPQLFGVQGKPSEKMIDAQILGSPEVQERVSSQAALGIKSEPYVITDDITGRKSVIFGERRDFSLSPKTPIEQMKEQTGAFASSVSPALSYGFERLFGTAGNMMIAKPFYTPNETEGFYQRGYNQPKNVKFVSDVAADFVIGSAVAAYEFSQYPSVSSKQQMQIGGASPEYKSMLKGQQREYTIETGITAATFAAFEVGGRFVFKTPTPATSRVATYDNILIPEARLGTRRTEITNFPEANQYIGKPNEPLTGSRMFQQDEVITFMGKTTDTRAGRSQLITESYKTTAIKDMPETMMTARGLKKDIIGANFVETTTTIKQLLDVGEAKTTFWGKTTSRSNLRIDFIQAGKEGARMGEMGRADYNVFAITEKGTVLSSKKVSVLGGTAENRAIPLTNIGAKGSITRQNNVIKSDFIGEASGTTVKKAAGVFETQKSGRLTVSNKPITESGIAVITKTGRKTPSITKTFIGGATDFVLPKLKDTPTRFVKMGGKGKKTSLNSIYDTTPKETPPKSVPSVGKGESFTPSKPFDMAEWKARRANRGGTSEVEITSTGETRVIQYPKSENFKGGYMPPKEKLFEMTMPPISRVATMGEVGILKTQEKESKMMTMMSMKEMTLGKEMTYEVQKQRPITFPKTDTFQFQRTMTVETQIFKDATYPKKPLKTDFTWDTPSQRGIIENPPIFIGGVLGGGGGGWSFGGKRGKLKGKLRDSLGAALKGL